MTNQNDTAAAGAETRVKPRLVLMGEFSSGKSTLSNILLGGATLPMQVTATRLPPVIVSCGAPGAFARTHAGEVVPVDLTDLSALTPQHYRSLHVTLQSDTLELCDLVDMPGISDPNMPADTWDQLVGENDHVIWCTHATQAWRQSEAAAWDRMRGATRGANLLLVTQFDKLRTPRDRARVMNRVLAETAGKFSAVFPVSLLDAMAAGDDFDAWRESGAHAVMERMVEILLAPHAAAETPSVQPDLAPLILQKPLSQSTESPGSSAVLNVNFDQNGRRQTERLAGTESLDVIREVRVMPRRVQARPDANDRPRPQRPTRSETTGWPNGSGQP
jgi:hypothetical protein